jgi:hypothetical protein
MLLRKGWYVYTTKIEEDYVSVLLHNYRVLDPQSTNAEGFKFIFKYRKNGKVDIIAGQDYMKDR